MLGLNQRFFCVRFWEPEGWVDFGRRPIEMQKRKLSMEQLKVWLKNEKLSSSNQIIPRHISHHEISMEKRRTLFSCGGCRSLLTYDYIVLKASHKGMQQHFTPQTQTFNATSAGFGKWKRLLWWPGWEEGWVTCNYSVLVAQIIPHYCHRSKTRKSRFLNQLSKMKFENWPDSKMKSRSCWLGRLLIMVLQVNGQTIWSWMKGKGGAVWQKKQKTGRWLPTNWAYRLKGRLCRSKRKVVGPNRLRFPAKLLFTRSVGWEQKSSSAAVNWPAWS